MHKKSSHFQGKSPIEHVVSARKKGMLASAEIHGAELAGHYSAASDAAKETAFILLLLWTLFDAFCWNRYYGLFALLFVIGFLLWKIGRSAILGYNRLERLHRLIEEEKWEIEHHRSQEREELSALYAAKGFSGKLLDEVIDVLMADDNRLLQEMLEEELGLNLESYEHPLKQAAGAGIGVILSSFFMAMTILFLPFWAAMITAALIIAISAGLTANLEKNKPLPAIIWNLAVAALASSIAYFAAQVF